MFLHIEGDIGGESGDDTYGGEIDVLAWSWGMTNSGSFHVGGGGGAGKANFQDISVTKWIDSSTHALMKSCSKGTHFTSAKLIVRKAGDDPLEYLTVEMKKVLVTSVSTGGSGGEDRLTENVSLNFQEFKVIYKPQKETGGGDADKEFAFNIAKNAEA